jgi:hypothetical protein
MYTLMVLLKLKYNFQEVVQSVETTFFEAEVTNLNFLPPLVRTCQKKKEEKNQNTHLIISLNTCSIKKVIDP